MRRKLHFLSS